MACKTETKEINGREFSVREWPAEKAILMQLKLVKVLGPAVAALAASVDSSESLGNAVALLFDKSSPEDVLSLIREVLEGVAVEGERMTKTSINQYFANSDSALLEIYQVFFFVLSVNFGGLLKGPLGEKLARAGQVLQSA